ncbi:TetR/AcrR family transcriptional regulator [Shewanella yunxiaonensis]|uniref:TetR/AcrR family transcriptional regulator n=1 Tax=Shewanella yunxiaonensis TaxID=2829809 RepID=A0ABX7YSK3_9GAMM|nr:MULTISPECIES: TetR/AcrR family transcriptional regulator [Shewanella]MDF0535539.1 TetR/AcrR family transcriptional regulator [Shewanella sp. A32]QUN05314.1 TetR/AcrR family transcriptional regulator [Shewanella yunxiaonensis]
MRVKTEEKRQAIIDIAKEAFFSQGFEQTSMSYISQQLGGSKATLYNYFNSKEEIFHAVMESSATEQIADAFQSLSQTKDMRTMMLEFGHNYLNSILTPEIMAIDRMVRAEVGRSDLGKQFYAQGPQRGWLNVSEFLAKRMDKAEIRRAEPWLAAMQFKALLEAEILMPYSLGAVDKPDNATLTQLVATAVDSFLQLYKVD